MRDLYGLFPDGFSGFIAAIAPLFWILQFGLIIHVYRTGRPYYWILILFMAPLIGGLAYILIELAPGFRSPRGLWFSIKPRRWRIADLRNELEETNTVHNRGRLAEELFKAGEKAEASEIANECLSGVFKNDPHLLVDAARYKVALGKHQEALEFLDRCDTKADKRLVLDKELVRGDALAGLVRYDEAEVAYAGIVDRFIGEAPRVGLASVYSRTGRTTEAVAIWKDITQKYRRGTRIWRRSERDAFRAAKRQLKAVEG